MNVLMWLAGLLIIFWILGLLLHIAGAFIHLLLIIAVVLLIIRFLRRA